MEILAPINVPEGDSCKFENGEYCRQFHWGYEDIPFCRCWIGKPSADTKIVNFKKHEYCLKACKKARKKA